MARKRYLKPGDLMQLRRVLWQSILDTKAVTDRATATTEDVLKVGHCLAALANAYGKLVQESEWDERLKALENRTP
jgi:hypothetical protein